MRKTIIFIAILTILVGMSVLIDKESLLMVIGVAALGLIAILYDFKHSIARGRSSQIIPLIIATPFLYWFRSASASRIANMAGWFVFLIYFFVASSMDRQKFWQRTKRLGWPLLLYMLILTFAYLSNGTLLQDNLLGILAEYNGYHWFPWLGASGYFLLACFYCRSKLEILKLIKWMLIMAIFQAIFSFQTYTGALSNIPVISNLFTYGSGSIRKAISATGTLGDTELLSELMASMIMFGIGWLAIKKRFIYRIPVFFVIIIFGMTGLFTGMRGFWVIGLLGLFLSVVLQRQKNILEGIGINFFLPITLVIPLVYAILPDQMFDWFTFRLNNFTNELVTGNYMNRTPVYNAGFFLLKNMPFYGYGGSWWEVFHEIIRNQTGGYNIWYTHSIYIWAVLTAGYLGLVLIIAIFFISALSMRQVWMIELKLKSKYVSYALALFIITILLPIHEVKADMARLSVFIQFYFILWGIVSSWYCLSNAKENRINSQLLNRPLAKVEH